MDSSLRRSLTRELDTTWEMSETMGTDVVVPGAEGATLTRLEQAAEAIGLDPNDEVVQGRLEDPVLRAVVIALGGVVAQQQKAATMASPRASSRSGRKRSTSQGRRMSQTPRGGTGGGAAEKYMMALHQTEKDMIERIAGLRQEHEDLCKKVEALRDAASSSPPPPPLPAAAPASVFDDVRVDSLERAVARLEAAVHTPGGILSSVMDSDALLGQIRREIDATLIEAKEELVQTASEHQHAASVLPYQTTGRMPTAVVAASAQDFEMITRVDRRVRVVEAKLYDLLQRPGTREDRGAPRANPQWKQSIDDKIAQLKAGLEKVQASCKQAVATAEDAVATASAGKASSENAGGNHADRISFLEKAKADRGQVEKLQKTMASVMSMLELPPALSRSPSRESLRSMSPSPLPGAARPPSANTSPLVTQYVQPRMSANVRISKKVRTDKIAAARTFDKL